MILVEKLGVKSSFKNGTVFFFFFCDDAMGSDSGLLLLVVVWTKVLKCVLELHI